MTEVQQAFLAFHAVFAFAFTLAFALPLAIAGAEERTERAERMRRPESILDSIGPLVDLWLLLEDSIPVFWLFRVIRDAPEDARAARKKWKEESSIRLCFWISLVLVFTFPLYFIQK